MRYYSVREAKWITLGAQAKKPGTKGANGKKHGGVAVLIGDDGVILKGPAHMKGKKPDELGGRQKTLGEKPGEKQEPKKYQNLAFGPDGEIAEPDAPKSPPPGTRYADLRAAAAQPAPEPTPAPAPAKPAKPVKVPKVAKVAKPEPVAAPTPEPKPEKGETVRAKIARIKAEKEKRYNDTLKKRGKKEADKQKADDKRQAKAEKDALNPAQAEARKKKQVERISKINAARPESLISLVRKEGGISGGDYDYATDIKEFGLKSALNKRGLKLDDMAKALQNAGHLVVPEGKKAEDVLLAGLQTRANSALHNHTGRYDSEYDDFINNREDADNAPGADSDRTASVISRGEEAGTDQGDDDSLAQILGFEPSRSDADEPEPSDYGHPDDYEPSDYEPEEGDLGDGGEITGADTSFDFGAPEPEPAKAPAPSPEPTPTPAAAKPQARPEPEPEPESASFSPDDILHLTGPSGEKTSVNYRGMNNGKAIVVGKSGMQFGVDPAKLTKAPLSDEETAKNTRRKNSYLDDANEQGDGPEAFWDDQKDDPDFTKHFGHSKSQFLQAYNEKNSYTATPKAEPAPEPTPATAPEPGTGYDDLRAAAAKKPLPPTPPAGLADRIAKRGTPTTIGPAKPVDPTDYNDPKEKARIAAFISRDLSGAASPKAAAKKLVRDLRFVSKEGFQARLDAVKSEFPEIYQAFKEDPGIAGPDAHAEIAAHTGGEPPKEFPGAAPSRIPGEGFADLRAAAAKEPEATPAVGKPAHEMTRAEFLAQAPTDKAKQYMDTSSMHRNKVQAALDGGQNVPSEVLADYPGIKKTEPQPQQGPTAREIKAKLQAETDARQAQGEQDGANVRARNNQDYQKSRQAAIDAGQDVEDGDEKQIRRTIRQNEKDKASALGTIARNGPDTDAQDFADSMDRENNRLKAKLPKGVKPAAPPTVKPSTPAPGEGFADLRAAAKEPEAPTITPHKADKTYLQLLKKSKNLVGASDDNNGIYEIDKKHLKPEILQKLRDPESKGRKYYGDAPETDSFRLAWKHDVTGDPNDDGVMIIDKRQHSIAQAKKRAERLASVGKTEKGEQAQKKQKEDDETERKVLKWLEQNPDSTHSELRRRTGHPTFDSSSPMDNPAHAAVDRLEKSGKITRSKGDLPSFSIADEQPAPAPAPSPGEGFADLRAAAAKEPEAPTITPEPSAASPRDLEKSEQRTPDEHAKGELLKNRSIFGGLKRTKAEAKEVLAKRIQQILDSPGMSKVATDFGLTPEQTYTTAKINGKWAVIPSHASDVATATYRGNPVSAEAVEKYGIILPKNYTKQGEMYVAEPSQPEEPEQPKPPEPKKKKPPTQKTKGLTDDPEKFQQGDRFKGENGEEFQVFASRQGALTAHPVVDGKPQINKSTEKKFAITDAAAAANPTHRRDFVPGFDQSQPGRDSEEIAQDRARLAKTPPPSPGEGFADLRAAAKEPEATPPAPPAPPEAPTAKGPDRRSYAERISAGESPEKIMAELDQRSDIARSQRDRPEATPAEKATAQAEIQHARNVSDDKARADVAEKMNKKAADAKSLASVEKPKITIEKSIGYSGKTGDPSYLAKISGKHNGKTFNREFQNGDEDKKAKSDAFRKKKGTYNETHEISPGELYEHAQNGTKKLLAIQPALDGGTAGQKVSFEIAELKEASKILKSFDDSETPNPNGFGANADFVKPLLAHQAKMAKKAGSYEGLTLPVVAKDLEGS
ncbi:hypothetical protein UFOVP829_53 [uncultured Caudovirales phage]|uniref:Uncharacterized protein n=1 Tax=uncultured Caudovirales phage TaxID=2100421 RepID=A0A6J5R1X1_9CAUD|nr:hypothetical protein UFOVP493_31 [uncultured Caudovirales phage]CAB4164558.1 hypothetical protein UFOVP829_53 [uncultured Caudovirales phage]CAB4177584.1 hypothetical protein UFOVP1003_15 [uncultured Caudovirales phage]CAB4187551.1 hypothetical protein UFOVP1153_31 [uncultured Caudovirales phage]